MSRLTGKTALVTAAGQGIGRAIANRLAVDGAQVIATDLSVELLTDFADFGGGQVRTQQLDVTDKGAIAALIGSVNRLDVLVNCAGFVHHGDVLTATDDEWSFAFDLNARSMFWMMQAAIPLIRVNAICPGTVDSPSWRQRVLDAAAATGSTEVEARADFVARQPMGRVGTPDEIAHLAAYLAGDEASFTTGQTHIIDGGWNM